MIAFIDFVVKTNLYMIQNLSYLYIIEFIKYAHISASKLMVKQTFSAS